jgi:hypothetical protein
MEHELLLGLVLWRHDQIRHELIMGIFFYGSFYSMNTCWLKNELHMGLAVSVGNSHAVQVG